MASTYNSKVSPIDSEAAKLARSVEHISRNWAEFAYEGWLKFFGMPSDRAVILINADTRGSMLFHYTQDKESIRSSRNVKVERYDLFMKEPGRKIALPIHNELNNKSASNEIYRNMQNDGIEIMPPIEINTAYKEWDVLFSADTGEVIIYSLKKQTESYNPFPADIFAGKPNSDSCNKLLNTINRHDLIQQVKRNLYGGLSDNLSSLNLDSTKKILSDTGEVYSEPEVQNTLFSVFSNGHVFNCFDNSRVESEDASKVLQTIDLVKQFAVGTDSIVQIIFAYKKLADQIEMKVGPSLSEIAFESLDHADVACEELLNTDEETYKTFHRIIGNHRTELKQTFKLDS